METEEYFENIKYLAKRVKESGDEVYLPGEKSFQKSKSSEFLTLTAKQVEDLDQLLESLDISARVENL